VRSVARRDTHWRSVVNARVDLCAQTGSLSVLGSVPFSRGSAGLQLVPEKRRIRVLRTTVEILAGRAERWAVEGI
jgi:hypothetical protein